MSVFPFKPDEIIGTLTAEYQARKELQQQIFDLLQANQLTPSAENYYNLGVYLAQHQQWEGAIALFLHAVSLNPTGVDAYYNLGAVLQALQQYKSAIAFLLQGDSRLR
ncbi:MAG: tetratricopeptide repeat protein [Desertifilum sp.]|nr:tetratricopeptide repeat protein [Desertifilum sp.]